MEDTPLVPLKRPFFFPIVSSSILAANLKKKSTGRVDGFIVEGTSGAEDTMRLHGDR